jgi:DNA-binding CsgD family transcriptional regulator
MVVVSADDLAEILTAVHRLNAVPELAAFPAVATSELRRVIASEIVSYNEVDPSVPRAVAHVDPEESWQPEVHGPQWERYSAQHPMLVHLLRTGDGSARRISDFCTSAEFHRLDLYQRFYRELGVEYQLSCTLPAPEPLVIALALSRAHRDYSERDRTVLNLLRPHMIQAYWNAAVRDHLRSALASMQRAFETRGWGVALTHDDVVEVLTPDVADWLSSYVDRDDFQTWIARERDASRRGVLARPLVETRDGRRLIVRFTPGVEGPDVLLFDERPTDDGSAALQRLGLRPREAEVLLLASRGLRNTDIAQELRISPSTVKHHLERIYLKLGVHNRTEATALALEAFATHPS